MMEMTDSDENIDVKTQGNNQKNPNLTSHWQAVSHSCPSDLLELHRIYNLLSNSK